MLFEADYAKNYASILYQCLQLAHHWTWSEAMADIITYVFEYCPIPAIKLCCLLLLLLCSLIGEWQISVDSVTAEAWEAILEALKGKFGGK